GPRVAGNHRGAAGGVWGCGMSAFKGTPGPWRLSSESPTIIKQCTSLIGLPDGGVLIGSACGHESSGFFPTNEQAISNARLIAAAPELLEALESVLGNCLDSEGLAAAYAKARAAIAKARGEQS